MRAASRLSDVFECGPRRSTRRRARVRRHIVQSLLFSCLTDCSGCIATKSAAAAIGGLRSAARFLQHRGGAAADAERPDHRDRAAGRTSTVEIAVVAAELHYS